MSLQDWIIAYFAANTIIMGIDLFFLPRASKLPGGIYWESAIMFLIGLLILFAATIVSIIEVVKERKGNNE